MVTAITCSPDSKDCMYNVCPVCKGQEYAIEAEGNLRETVNVTQWSTETVIRERKNNDGIKEKVPMKSTDKKKKDMELGDLLDWFQVQLTNFKRHLFNIKQQFSHYRELSQRMTDKECLIHVFFFIIHIFLFYFDTQCNITMT